jgi:hypothetical protein
MQHEFNNRIAAQRAILQVLNGKKWGQEELFGLSRKAINRWVSVNRIDPDSKLVNLIKEASARLFFLANKSQQQISDEYTAITEEIAALRDAIESEATRVG